MSASEIGRPSLLAAHDELGRTRQLPPAEQHQSVGLTWWSRGSLMVFDPHSELVERFASCDDGFRRAEMWSLDA